MEGGVSRRELLAASAAGALLASATARAAPPKRPNVLCFVSEDCGATHLPVYGGAAQTPNISRLAADGVTWEHCYSAAPVCAPSRTAMITGLAPESCGPAENMRAEGRLPAGLRRRGWPARLRAAGYYCTNNVKTDYNVPIDMAATWDASSGTAHWRDRPAGVPFFAIFNPQDTHESTVFLATPLDARDDVQIPPYLPDTPTTRGDAARYLAQISQMDRVLGQRLAELEADGVADDTIVLYYSDHAGALPRSKRFCFDSGLRIPLIARFGRNVSHLAPGRPGSVIRAPVASGVDLPVTILGFAGLAPDKRMRGVAFAGPRRRQQRYAFSMRNRMDERYDMQRSARDRRYRYTRNYMPHVPYGQHVQFMWLQAGYREWEQRHHAGQLDEVQARFWRPKPAEELYDVDADPHEICNLAGDPRYAPALRRMRAALDRHMLATNDNGFIPEGSPLAGWDRSRAGDYPLRRVMLLTAKAIRREPRFLPTLVRHLDDRSEVLRFWAALGCVMLGARAAPATAALRRAFEGDASTHVRVAAAEALVGVGETAAPVAFLGARLVGDDSTWIRLYAANALDHIGERARPALPQLLVAAALLDSGQAPEPYVAQAARHTALRLAGVTVPLP